MSEVHIFQIFYKPDQYQYCSPLVAHYDNSKAENEPCLENHVIKKLIDKNYHLNCDYFGVLSWAFERKRAASIENLLPFVCGNFDVYGFDKHHTQPNVWQKAETWHKGIIECAREVFDEMGVYDFDKIETPNIYSNSFLAKPVVYEIYVNEWLTPFMEILMRNEKAKVDTGYKQRELDKIHLEKATGYPYYTLMPFICERLFSTFLAFNRHIKLKHIA